MKQCSRFHVDREHCHDPDPAAARVAGRPAVIPVHLVTGFLGSGKTTLLNRLLSDPALGDSAVVVNELGEIAIDHGLVTAAEEDLVVLQSGCVCCSVRGDLVDALSDLFGRRSAGLVPPFARVLLETTGLADPGPVLQTLMSDAALVERYRAGSVTTTVDALNGAGQLARHAEAVRQVAFADRIVLTKLDLGGVDDGLLARLSGINATVPVMEAGGIQASVLLEEVAPAPARAMPAFHGHAADIKAHCVVIAEPIEWHGLVRWLDSLTSLRGADMLRIKGIVRARGHDRPIAVNGVHHVLHRPEVLERWPDGRPETRLVVITKGIGQLDLERALVASGAIETREE